MSRTDFYYDPAAPAANSLKPAAAVALFDTKGRLLLLRRKDNEKWTMPGGTLEFGESLSDCAIREVKEETGLDIEITGLIGTYTDPHIVVAYSDGEVRQEFTFVFSANIKGGTLGLDHESTAYEWMNLEDALQLPLAESQCRRLRDVQVFIQSGRVALR
jgi:8-oxo-dGTP diphosphatase